MDKAKVKEWLQTKSDNYLSDLLMELELERGGVADMPGAAAQVNELYEQIDCVCGEMIRRQMITPKQDYIRRPVVIPSAFHILALGDGNVDEERNFVLKPRPYVPSTYFQLMAR